MLLNPFKKEFGIKADDLIGIGYLLAHAIRDIKKATKKSLEPYKQETAMDDADHAMKNIIDVAVVLGIDLGGNFGHKIDSSILDD